MPYEYHIMKSGSRPKIYPSRAQIGPILTFLLQVKTIQSFCRFLRLILKHKKHYKVLYRDLSCDSFFSFGYLIDLGQPVWLVQLSRTPSLPVYVSRLAGVHLKHIIYFLLFLLFYINWVQNLFVIDITNVWKTRIILSLRLCQLFWFY